MASAISVSSSSHKHTVKKGPWTVSEDMILVEYVKKNGEGNWNAVQRNSGLMRCGKSCRLRWANHLRPNLKKGAFSSEEEKLIVQLHAKFGNKWARMAAQLPGRTDNEIKNFWNTRLKRRQRAGLPIYPQEAVQQDQKQLVSSPPSSILSLLASFKSPDPNTNPLPFYDSFSSTNHHQFKLSSASSSSLPAAPPPFLNQGGLPIAPFHQYNANLGDLGLPSIQSPAASSSDFVMANTTSCDGAEDYEAERGGNGELEDLFGESQILACAETGNAFTASVGSSNFGDKTVAIETGNGNGNQCCGGNQKYQGTETEVVEEGITLMDDDLLNQLLDNFPLSIPIPEWNGQNTESHTFTNRTTSYSMKRNQDWRFG